MALSATIGNPEQVAGWLQDVKSLQQKQDQEKKQQSPGTSPAAVSYKVRLIQHSERYADLRYHRYDTAASQTDDPPGFEQTLRKLHPYAVLDAHQIAQSGFPSDLALEPSDCLELFHSLQSALQHQAPETDEGWDVSQQPQSEATPAGETGTYSCPMMHRRRLFAAFS